MDLAVEVRNGSKKFGKGAPVLDYLNLSVQRGSIYGLLGSSGCGKTTLLSCVVGLKELDSGEILVFGNKPGTKGSGVLGYMPQDIALITIFTIKEMLYYYGRIYGMEKSEIKERTKFLSIFLDLPDTSRLIGNLSGGQLRRVSLAVALIHRPPLIILDEPTVGLDPVLRESIWEHLMELVTRERTTIIITTHYLEEAKCSNTVGILRKGRLLAENSPQSLLSFHNSNSLEKVVLNLCRDAAFAKRCSILIANNMKVDNNESHNTIKNDAWRREHFTFPTGVELTGMRKLSTISYSHEWMNLSSTLTNEKLMERVKQQGWRKDARIIGALMRKTLLRQIRHPAAILVQLLVPILQILIYENIVGVEPKGSGIGFVSTDWNRVVGENNSLKESDLLQYCSTNFDKNGTCLLQMDNYGMSSICGFMNQFESGEIRWTYQTSVPDALERVKTGKLMGYLEFPPNFTYHLRNRFLEKNFVGNVSLLGSIINIRMDESSALNKEFVRTAVMTRYQTFVKSSVAQCGVDPRLIQLPLNFHGIYEKENESWILYIQPGLIIMFMFVLANLPSVVLVMEKREGVADRGAVAGIKFSHILIASFLSDSVMILGQIGVFFFVLPTFYGMRVEGSWILGVALVYLTALSGLAFGLWWATMTTHEMELILVLLFVNITNIVSSGLVWPLEAVTKTYRIFCLGLPVSFPMQALRSIMFKGWGIKHPEVMRGFGAALLWTVIPVLISLLVVKLRK